MLWLEFKFGIEDKGFSAPNFFNDSVRDITQTPILYSLVGTVNEQKV